MTSTAAETTQLHPRLRELAQFMSVHRDGLHEAIASVPPDLRDRKPAPDRWSVAEVLEHLSMVETRVATLVTRYVAEARASGVEPDTSTSSVVASFPNPERLTNRAMKIDAPKLVIPGGSLDSAQGIQALARSRETSLHALQNANGVSLENLTHAHPVFGVLNMYHWFVVLGMHDARHAAQIREIGAALAEQ